MLSPIPSIPLGTGGVHAARQASHSSRRVSHPAAGGHRSQRCARVDHHPRRRAPVGRSLRSRQRPVGPDIGTTRTSRPGGATKKTVLLYPLKRITVNLGPSRARSATAAACSGRPTVIHTLSRRVLSRGCRRPRLNLHRRLGRGRGRHRAPRPPPDLLRVQNSTLEHPKRPIGTGKADGSACSANPF